MKSKTRFQENADANESAGPQSPAPELISRLLQIHKVIEKRHLAALLLLRAPMRGVRTAALSSEDFSCGDAYRFHSAAAGTKRNRLGEQGLPHFEILAEFRFAARQTQAEQPQLAILAAQRLPRQLPAPRRGRRSKLSSPGFAAAASSSRIRVLAIEFPHFHPRAECVAEVVCQAFRKIPPVNALPSMRASSGSF